MEKLLAIASLGQRAYGRWLFQHLILGIIVVIGLVMVIAIMVSTILIGSLAAAYFTLLSSGIGQTLAMLAVALLAIAITTAVIFLTFLSLHRLRRMPHTLLKRSPVTSSAMDALNAFTNGLMAD
jgi:hypothetical protein